MDFVDDVDLESRAARGVLGVLAKLADVLDARITGGVHFHHVQVFTGADLLADITLVTGRGRGAFFAV